MAVFGQLVIAGILLGGVYALLSVGLTLIFGVVRIVNFAHGDFVMLAMYATYFLWVLQLDPYLAAPLVTATFFLFGMAVERLVIRRTLTAPHLVQVFVTLGLSVVFVSFAHLAWSADFRIVRTAYSAAIVAVGPIRVTVVSLAAFLVAMATSGLLFLFLRKTQIGAAIRATAQDRQTAAVMGIEVPRVYNLTFGLGIACAGLAGALLTPMYPAFPSVGLGYALIAFVVVILGGLGSFPGAIIGGLLVGVIETLSGYYLAPSLKEAAYFTLFIGVLVLRPAGLLGIRGSELTGIGA
jgi:branched-chain amino acid transport system permease protein